MPPSPRFAAGLTAALIVLASAAAPPAHAAVAQSAAVTTDCTSSRIQETVVNRTSAATTFTLTWPGVGTWTARAAAGDSAHFYFTRPSSTAYTFRTTTPEGFDQTDSGTLDCSDALSVRAAMDCGSPHRLRLILANDSPASRTFTVAWPGRPYSPWTVTVPAGSGHDGLYWTVPDGTPYTFNVTSGSWSDTVSGTSGCGVGSGRPGMNAQTVLTTSTVIDGLGKAAKSVRIPALAVSNSGTVIATMDARVDGSYDLGGGTNNIQIAMTRSTDGGATFTRPKIIAKAPTASEGYGDPSLLVDRATGEIFCFFTYAPKPGVGYWGSTAGDTSATSTTNTHIRYITSTDDGATWSAPVDLNPHVRKPAWAGMFASSGHGIQLASGRLVQPIVYRDSSGDHASDIYSDDHGATWHNGTTAGTGVNESKVIQRSTGRVAQNMRSNAGANRWYATAPDVTSPFGTSWNSGLIDPGCNGDEISYLYPTLGNPSLTSIALHSNNAATSRTDLTVRVSRDDGTTWPHEALIKPGAAGYSTMAVLPDGSLGTLYEIGDTGGMVFTRTTLPWLES